LGFHPRPPPLGRGAGKRSRAAAGGGFLELADGRTVFCHCSVLQRAGLQQLVVGAAVGVDIEVQRDGRLRASRIEPAPWIRIGREDLPPPLPP